MLPAEISNFFVNIAPIINQTCNKWKCARSSCCCCLLCCCLHCCCCYSFLCCCCCCLIEMLYYLLQFLLPRLLLLQLLHRLVRSLQSIPFRSLIRLPVPLNFSITNKILFECFRLLVTLTFWAAFAKGRGGKGAKLSRAANAKSAVKNFAEICDVLLGSHSLSVCVSVFVSVSRGREPFICTSISPSTLAVALWRLQSPRLHLPTNYSRLQQSRAERGLHSTALLTANKELPGGHQESQLDSLSLNPSARQVLLAAILFLNVLFTALSALKIAQSSAPKNKGQQVAVRQAQVQHCKTRGREVRGQHKIM